jgi:hypothetical protein
MTLRWTHNLALNNNFTDMYLRDLDARVTACEAQYAALLLQPRPLRTRHLMKQHLQSHKMLEAQRRMKRDE